MGLYRTIPQDVEAVQFGGMNDGEPILKDMASLPSWMWRGITRGVVAFDSAGVKVHGQVLKADDWVVYDGAFIGSMDDEKFKATFVPARKPLSEMASAPRSIAARRGAEAVASTPAAAPEMEPAPATGAETAPVTVAASAPTTIGVSTEEIPDDVDAILNRLNGKQDAEVA